MGMNAAPTKMSRGGRSGRPRVSIGIAAGSEPGTAPADELLALRSRLLTVAASVELSSVGVQAPVDSGLVCSPSAIGSWVGLGEEWRLAASNFRSVTTACCLALTRNVSCVFSSSSSTSFSAFLQKQYQSAQEALHRLTKA